MAFLNALAKIGLVELDEDEKASAASATTKKDAPKGSTPELSDEEFAAIMGEDYVPEPAPVATRAAPTARVAAAPTSSDPTAPLVFANVYALSTVPPVPFPAEQLLRVLDGLRAMDTATRKMAILAMDAADDGWTIADPVLDAQRKVKALDGARGDLAKRLAAAEQAADAEMKNLDAYQEEAVKTIRDKIAEFEATLTKELQSVADQKAKLRAQLDAQRAATARENARVTEEMTRLSELEQVFGPELRKAAAGS